MANAGPSGIFDLSIGNLYHSFYRGPDRRKMTLAMAMGGHHQRGEWPGKWYSMNCCRHNKIISAICALILGLLFMPFILLGSLFLASIMPTIMIVILILKSLLFLLRIIANIAYMVFK